MRINRMEVIHMKALIVCINLIVATMILAPQGDAKIDSKSIPLEIHQEKVTMENW